MRSRDGAQDQENDPMSPDPFLLCVVGPGNETSHTYVSMELIYIHILGRGKNSHAYTHSVQVDHRVWLNLHSLKFYCLPDNYEIIDPSLEDIKVCVHVCSVEGSCHYELFQCSFSL